MGGATYAEHTEKHGVQSSVLQPAKLFPRSLPDGLFSEVRSLCERVCTIVIQGCVHKYTSSGCFRRLCFIRSLLTLVILSSALWCDRNAWIRLTGFPLHEYKTRFSHSEENGSRHFCFFYFSTLLWTL